MNRKITKKDFAAELKMSTKTLDRNREFMQAQNMLQSKTSKEFIEYLEKNYKVLGLSRKVFVVLANIPMSELTEFVTTIENTKGKFPVQKHYIKNFIAIYSTTKLSIPVHSVQLIFIDEMCRKFGSTRTDMIRNFLEIMTRVYNENEDLDKDTILKINMRALFNDRKNKDKCLIKNK